MKLLLLAASFACVFAPKTFAQYDIVVNTGGAVSCVTALQENGFSAFSWSVGGTVNVSTTTAIPRSSSPSLSSIQINKNLDQCSSPQLQRHFFAGTHFPVVILTQYRNSHTAKPLPLAVVTLTDATLTDYSLSGTTDSSVSENLAFMFAKLCIKDYKYDDAGNGSSTQACYDVNTHVESPASVLLNSKSQMLRQTK